MRLIDADNLVSLCKIMADKTDSPQIWEQLISMIESVPTIEAEPVKHGRWIVVSDGYGNGDATAHICECSECKDTIWVYKKATRRWNYCPNCGARMDLNLENEDHHE